MLDLQTKRDLAELAEESLYVFSVLHRQFKERHSVLQLANSEAIAGALAAGIMTGRSVRESEGSNVG